MKGFYKFLTIFRTNLIRDVPQTIICDSVKIEIFKGSRSYKVPLQLSSIIPVGENHTISKDNTLVLDKEGIHIELVSRTKEPNPTIARRICEDSTDRIIAIISSVHKPEIFDNLIYRGWLLEEKTGIVDAWIKVSEIVEFDKKFINDLVAVEKKLSLDADLSDRFRLISRFYCKSLIEKPSEEKFLWLWTILEIFPMRNTTNIRPISELLASITGKQPDGVKEKLDMGRLYGLRCDLFHNGKWDIDVRNEGEMFTKLDNIVREVLRNMCGLPYSGSLDKYL